MAVHARNAHIELLRLVAIVAITLFHVFLSWDTTFVVTTSEALGYTSGSWLLGALLGFISLLGSWGNHLFFMISGYFLIPRAQRRLEAGTSWHELLLMSVRRVLHLLEIVAFWWLVVALLAPRLFPAAEPIWLNPKRFVWGLEFIWLYCAAILCVPLAAWLRAQRSSRAALIGVGIALYLGNAYLAFCGQEVADSAAMSWQKCMSGLTYLYSFYVAGTLGDRKHAHPARTFVCVLCAVAIIELVLSVSHNYGLAAQLAYKSTSLAAFVLALTAFMWAARAQSQLAPAVTQIICAVSPSVVGFYILQSLTWDIWTGLVTVRVSAAFWEGPVCFMGTGLLCALAVCALFIALDMLLRRPIFALVGRLASLGWGCSQ